MTREIVENIKNNKKLCGAIMAGFLMVSYVGYNTYSTYKFHEEQKQMIQTQQQQIEKINQQIDDMHTQVNDINRVVELQQSVIEKTSGRLMEKHMKDSSVRVSRGERQSPYSFIVHSPSTITAYELNSVFHGTGLEGLGEAFVRAELNTGVNAVFLSSLAIHESSWGQSYLANAKNNLFGFAAYDGSPTESAKSFSSKEECIEQVAEFIAKNYCNKNGAYYKGGTIAAINTVYATDGSWKDKVFNTMQSIERKASDC